MRRAVKRGGATLAAVAGLWLAGGAGAVPQAGAAPHLAPAAPAAPAVPAWLVADWKTISTDTQSNTRARWTISVYADGQFQFGQNNVLFFDDGRVAVAGRRITFTERVARGERCAGAERTGIYTLRRTVATLTLTALRDPCRWRREILTAQPLQRVAR